MPTETSTQTTVQACMEMADAVAPNAVPVTVKLRWLGELEGKVLVELFDESPAATRAITASNVTSARLTVPHPFDQIYWMYLVAMIHYAGGQSERYEQAAALFNAAYRDFAKWQKRKGGVQ